MPRGGRGWNVVLLESLVIEGWEVSDGEEMETKGWERGASSSSSGIWRRLRLRVGGAR